MAETICNTSPLQYLFQVDLLNLLPSLYGEVIVPEAVLVEIADGRRQGVVLPDIESLPWDSHSPAPLAYSCSQSAEGACGRLLPFWMNWTGGDSGWTLALDLWC